MEPDVERRFEHIEALLAEMERRLTEQLRDLQTELLEAVLPSQEQLSVQFRELDANTGNSVQAVKQRVELLERRMR
jgi:hypothetical protein